MKFLAESYENRPVDLFTRHRLLAERRRQLAKSDWEESQHPRQPAGSEAGGEFAPATTEQNKKFLDAMAVDAAENPLSREMLLMEYGVPVAAFELVDGSPENMVQLKSVRSLTRGGGARFMERLVRQADTHGTRLSLTAMPFDPGGGAGKRMTAKALIGWYRRYGFEAVYGPFMERKPHPVAKGQPGPGDVHAGGRGGPLRRSRWRRVPRHIAEALREDDNTIAKAYPTQQLLTGWASVITNADGSPHVDSQGDIIDEDELVHAAGEYMKGSRVVCDNHRRVLGPDGKEIPLRIGTTTESLVLTAALKKALGLPASTPTGWIVTMHIEDPQVWREVVDGRRAGLSIGGGALREPV